MPSLRYLGRFFISVGDYPEDAEDAEDAEVQPGSHQMTKDH